MEVFITLYHMSAESFNDQGRRGMTLKRENSSGRGGKLFFLPRRLHYCTIPYPKLQERTALCQGVIPDKEVDVTKNTGNATK